MTLHFAPITDRLKDSGGAKWAVHERSRQMRREGADIIELTIGEPDLPPDPALIEVAARAMRSGRTGYSSGRGEPALLDALARRYARRRPGVTAEDVLCFPGTQSALFATMMGLTGPGDGVLVGDPFYATYEGIIRASGAHALPVPLRPENGFRIRVADIAAALTPECRVLLLNSPQNPSGAVLDRATVREIGALCAERNLWLVCDEVYEDLVYDGPFASPFEIEEIADRVVALSSISKSCAAPGFRSGWAVGSEEFCRRILPISEAMLFGNQPFIADMTAYALDHPPDTAACLRRDYRRRSEALAQRLAKIPGLRPYLPESGMFLLADVSGTGLDGDGFAWRLLKAGVAVMPGSSFGDQARDLIRLSLTVPDDMLATAAERIAAFTETLACPHSL
ncbi:MAG: pyridoxal phosphate-dependent aminotransferase [Pseudomonadota bacterium]